jgi:hypothetical protein
MNKCKGCEWYGKPYWSIINPCDNCPRENTNVEILTRWQDPTIEELKKQLQQKENIIKEVRDTLEEYSKTEVEDYSKIIEFYKKLKNIVDKGE